LQFAAVPSEVLGEVEVEWLGFIAMKATPGSEEAANHSPLYEDLQVQNCRSGTGTGTGTGR